MPWTTRRGGVSLLQLPRESPGEAGARQGQSEGCDEGHLPGAAQESGERGPALPCQMARDLAHQKPIETEQRGNAQHADAGQGEGVGAKAGGTQRARQCQADHKPKSGLKYAQGEGSRCAPGNRAPKESSRGR